MEKNTKILTWLSGLFFLIVLILGGILFIRSKGFFPLFFKKDKQEEIKEEKDNLEIEIFHSKQEDSIRKQIFEEKGKGEVNYIIKAVITELKKNEQNKLLTGKIIIENDPLEREIRFFAGSETGKMFLGIYEDFSSENSSWKSVSNEEILKKVQLGEVIRILVEVPFDKNSNNKLYYLRKHEAFFDTLIKEFISNKFEYEIPENFPIYFYKLGIVR